MRENKQSKFKNVLEDVLSTFEQLSNEHFDYYWNISSPEEKGLIYSINEKGGIEASNVDPVVLKTLIQRCILVKAKDSDNQWRLFSSSFRSWLNKHQKIVVFRVVVASPSDVVNERIGVLKAIDNLNNTLTIMGKAYRLKMVEQKDAYPSVGNPEKLVSEQLEIPNAHIFIGIFWRRFGSPPRIVRTSGSSFSLSGTESEIDKAFEARKKNDGIKPEIMLYRKIDSPNVTKDFANEEDAIIQYARVIEFFRKMETGEKHQLLYVTFSGKEFIEKLQRDLLKICAENEIKWINLSSQPGNLHGINAMNDPEESWLARSPLKFNPFNDDIREKMHLEEYTTFPCSRSDLKRLISNESLIYIFGDKGAGKTTLLENIVRTVLSKLDKDILKDENIYCLRIGPEHFETQLERLGSIKDYQNYDFVRLVFNLVTDGVVKSVQRAIPRPDVDFRRPSETLRILLKWLRQEKYTSLLCLVDGLDEINSVKISQNPESEILELLRNIVTTPKVDGVRLRFFLTSNLELLMKREKKLFQLDHYPNIHLEWNEHKLIQILNLRFQVASRDGTNWEIGDLCPDVPEIEKELVKRANRNPRALLWLANRLFQIHVQENYVTDFIEAKSWLKVKDEWEIKKTDFIYVDNHDGFWVGANKVPFYNETEIELPKILSKILCCLIDAKGAICEPEKIIRAVYPSNEDTRYLMKTFYQQMGNLNKELNEIAPGSLQNVRGKGYRLIDPGSKSQEVKL